jgi:lysophospholipase L1-like esterase
MGFLRLFVLSVISAVATVGAVEGAARLLAAPPATRFLAQFTTDRAFVEPDAALGFRLVPGYVGSGYAINVAGFRGPAFPDDLADRFTVLCAGDSTTFGWLVEDGEDFPAQLSRRLQGRGGRALAINGGVPSYTSAQVLWKLREDLPRIEPDVVIVTMPWNDMWYSSFSPWTPDILVPRLPAPWRMWLLQRSAFFRTVASPPVAAPAVDRSSPDALGVFATNLSAVVDRVRATGAVVVFQTPPFDLDHVKPGGVRFAPTGLEWGRDFLVDVAGRYVQRFRTVAAERDVALVESPLSIQDLHQEALFVDEIHPTGEGYGLIATTLLRTLESQGMLP